MTRQGGTTPRGLPYPGETEIHPRTPAALQALAEAIEGQLTSLTPGIILDFYAATVALSGGYATLTFPRLAAVNGLVAVPGTAYGGTFAVGFIAGDANGFIRFVPSLHNATPPNTITVIAVGWGPPRT